MSVIGRLDEQVEAVLISPLKKDGQSKNEDDSEGTAERAQTRALTASQPRSRARMGEEESTRRARAGREELPVWLL